MKYLLLVHHNEEAFGRMSETKRKEMLVHSVQLTHQLHDDGQYLSASPLHPASTATIVRVREGQSLVTDGPFVEKREKLAGFFMVNVNDFGEADRIATLVTGAR